MKISRLSTEKLAADIHRLITNRISITTSSPCLSEAFKLKAWTLVFCLWNAFVDRANSSALSTPR
jgi:hypothetical protein